MRLISRHILRSMAAPFLWGVAALTGLLLLNSLPPLIDSFGGKGIPARTMIEGVVLFVPALVALTLPMSVLVAVLYGYSQLAASLELVAMYASGISVWRMARPALIAGAVVAVVNFLIFDQLMPQSNARFTNLRTAVAEKLPTLALRQQVLNVMPAQSGAQGFIIRADVITQETGAMRGVTIFDLTEYNERRLIRSDSGLMAMSANGKDLILTLHSGVVYEFKRDEPGRVQQTNFEHNRLVVRNVQNNLAQSVQRFGKNEKEMTSCELLDGITDSKWNLSRYQVQAEYLTRRDLRSMAGLPPLLQPGEQVRPATKPHCGAYRRFESWFKALMLPQKLSAQTPQNPATQVPQNPAPQTPQNPAAQTQQSGLPPAVQAPVVQPPGSPQFLVPPPGQQSSGLLSGDGFVSSGEVMINQARNLTLIYQVEYHQKFAVPLSCFCFVLLGMSLALKYPGSGIGLVIGGSLVIFLGFYIMLQGGRGIALAGGLDPAVAMYTPLVLFTAIGLWTVNSANREMGTARSAGIFDSVIDFFQRFRS